MEKIIQAVRIRDKMLQCRKSAKFLKGDKWNSEFKYYKDIIEAVMLKNKCDELKAVILLHELKSVQENGFLSMMIFATVAEILEPEK